LKKKVYSPDLAPSDFHLFPKLKEYLKDQRFSYDEEVKSAVRKWFQSFSCDEEVKSAVRKWFQKQNTNFLRTDFKN